MSVTRIAEKAGVSIATVSRVLNNSRPVNPRIAEQVRKAMAELNLPPRPLRRRRSSAAGAARHTTIAIVSIGQGYRDWFEVPVMAGVVAELTRAAQEHELGVLMTEMPDPTQLSPVLKRPEVGGALVFIRSGLTTKDVRPLVATMPVVRVMGGQLAPVEIDHVGVDNNAIGYLAGEHLLARALKDLAYLCMYPQWDLRKLRGQGFIAAAEAAGVRPTTYFVGEEDTPAGAYGPNAVLAPDLAALLRKLAERRGDRTMGLFVARDEEAVHVYRVMREIGLEPGRDLIVVSCDNESVRLSTLSPRPASIDLNAPEIARHAVRRLAARIKHRNEPPARILVNPRLVEGE
jgi:LacI family transcriptional regulator